MGSKKGFIHIVEVIIIVIMMFLVIWQFTYIPGVKTEWSRAKLALQSNDVLFSLDRKGIDWFDSEEVKMEFNKTFNQTNIFYDLKLINVIKPEILVGCICNITELTTANETLKPFRINGRQINFIVEQIDPSDQPEQYLSELYDVVLLWDYNLTGYEQVSGYLKADKGIVEVRELSADEINNFEVQKTLFGLYYNGSLSPTGQDITFTELISNANNIYYNIFKYFYRTPNSTGGLIEEPCSFSGFLESYEKVSPNDGDKRRVILRQEGSNSSALIVNQGMGDGFGRTAWLSESPMSEEMKVLIRDLVIWAAGDTYRVISNEITSPVTSSFYKLLKPKGIVAQWNFDEGSGTTARDTSGNTNHGEIIGADWVDGRMGKALEFDGVGDYVDCGNDDALDFGGGPFTFSAWIKLAEIDYRTVLSKGNSGIGAQEGAVLRIENDGRARLFVTGDSEVSAYSTDILSPGVWYHVAATKASSAMTVYVNGNPGVAQNPPNGSINSDITFRIGRYGDQASYYFNGTIDQVMIYNRALGPEEIRSLHDFPGQFMFQPVEVLLTLGYVY